MITECLIGSDGNGLVGPPNALRTGTEGTTIRTVIRRNEVIHTVDLIHMMALANGIALRDDRTLGFFDRTAHVGLQFCTFHLAITMNGIDLPVIIEEHTEIVDTALHIMMLPRTTDILRGVALKTLAIDIGKDIELPIGISDSRSPDALAIDLLMVLQREGVVSKIKAIETV